MKCGDPNMPGPGDPETWPRCTGHPMDPRTPEQDYDAMTPDEQIEELCETYSDRELAEMYQLSVLECDLLRARLRKAEADAARWLEVSRHGPAPMQFVTDPELGVFTRNGADADRHVDAAIVERRQRKAAEAAMAEERG